jgi:hypothetical protein
MNIVKFKDIYLTQENADQLTEDEMILFNKWFKGRYAYVVNWTWCVPFDVMTEAEYVLVSEQNAIGEYVNLLYSSILNLVDQSTTSRINSVELYKNLNKFVSDDEITLDELKNFRNWMAENLLEIRTNLLSGEFETLSYYKEDMFDQVIKSLSLFTTNTQPTVTYVNQKSCNCMTSNIKSNMTITNQCDAVSEYRRGIYNRMVELFSDYTYWIELDGFIAEFKRYIDGIISYNLPLYTSQYVNVFDDCTCASQTDALQQRGIRAMKNLSQALQYIIDNDVTGHKNFINTSLNVFASEYYEMMKWK